MSLMNLPADQVDWKELGSMLFIKGISGTRWEEESVACPLLHYAWSMLWCCRVIVPGHEKTIGPHTFNCWGAHSDTYPSAYLTAAAAIGMRREEVDLFAKKLDKALGKFRQKCTAKLAGLASPIAETQQDEGEVDIHHPAGSLSKAAGHDHLKEEGEAGDQSKEETEN